MFWQHLVDNYLSYGLQREACIILFTFVDEVEQKVLVSTVQIIRDYPYVVTVLCFGLTIGSFTLTSITVSQKSLSNESFRSFKRQSFSQLYRFHDFFFFNQFCQLRFSYFLNFCDIRYLPYSPFFSDFILYLVSVYSQNECDWCMYLEISVCCSSITVLDISNQSIRFI